MGISLGREPEGAVEADDLAVEVVVLADVLDQGRVLGGPPHAPGMRNLGAPVRLELVARLAVGMGQERARGYRDDAVHRALEFADHAVLLYRGQVAWQGPTGSAKHEFLARYLGETAAATGA